MDMSQYLEVFIDESKEHLQTINEQLLELEKTQTMWRSLMKFSALPIR